MSQIPYNTFTVGTDLQSCILFCVGTGQNIDTAQLGHLLEINSQQQSSKVTIAPVNYGGKRLHRNIYHDWAGRLVFARYNAQHTQLILDIINRYQDFGLETYFSIFGITQDPLSGLENEFLFSTCVIDDHEFGNYSGTAQVDQSFAFRAQTMTLVGNAPTLLAIV